MFVGVRESRAEMTEYFFPAALRGSAVVLQLQHIFMPIELNEKCTCCYFHVKKDCEIAVLRITDL